MSLISENINEEDNEKIINNSINYLELDKLRKSIEDLDNIHHIQIGKI